MQAYDADPADAIEQFGPIANWDVSLISTMSRLFFELENFNADISNWNTSAVTTMESMFYVRSTRAPRPINCWGHMPCTLLTPLHPTALQAPGPHLAPLLAPHCVPLLSIRQKAEAFNQPLSFDTSSVTTMNKMFYVNSACALRSDSSQAFPCTLHALSPPHRPRPASRPTPRSTSCALLSTRQKAEAFNQPLSFDTSSVTTMVQMFLNAEAFNQPLSFDTSKVTNMGAMLRVHFARVSCAHTDSSRAFPCTRHARPPPHRPSFPPLGPPPAAPHRMARF